MNTSPILPGEPFSKEKTEQIAKQFHRDGFVHIPGVLTSDEITALRDTTDRLFADASLAEKTNPHLADTRYIQM
ncbi:phytanoyl-CoA dioxygenase family protein, partial [Candidatus Poribacteria bacterium]|nr:phytanoyl-CoA dioxygenase family protein [Candidatus Poribacteria bacterium]